MVSDGLHFLIRVFIGPHHVVLGLARGADAPMRGVALVGTVSACLARSQMLEIYILKRDIIDRLMVLLRSTLAAVVEAMMASPKVTTTTPEKRLTVM